jgi:hypothetical protein
LLKRRWNMLLFCEWQITFMYSYATQARTFLLPGKRTHLFGELQDLVTSPATRDRMSRLSPSYIQDFLRLILLVSLLGEWNFKVPDVAWIIKKKQITLL